MIQHKCIDRSVRHRNLAGRIYTRRTSRGSSTSNPAQLPWCVCAKSVLRVCMRAAVVAFPHRGAFSHRPSGKTGEGEAVCVRCSGLPEQVILGTLTAHASSSPRTSQDERPENSPKTKAVRVGADSAFMTLQMPPSLRGRHRRCRAHCGGTRTLGCEARSRAGSLCKPNSSHKQHTAAQPLKDNTRKCYAFARKSIRTSPALQ